MIATLSKRGVVIKRVVGTQPNSIDPILSLKFFKSTRVFNFKILSFDVIVSEGVLNFF